MAKKFPEIKEKNEGKFTAWVEKNMGGMDTCKAASKVMRSRTKKYSPAVVKMANYANNFGCKNKKDDGASVPLKGKQKNLPDALKSKILASDGASMKPGEVKDISAKKFNRKKKRNKDKVTATGSSSTSKNGNTVSTHSKKSTVVDKKRKRFVEDEYINSTKGPKSGMSSRSVSYYKQKKEKNSKK
jgi:hypothetical protein